MTGRIRVGHVHRTSIGADESAVYVGRDMPNMIGSPLGNPYRGHSDEVLGFYEGYLQGQLLHYPDDEPAQMFRRLQHRLKTENENIVLLCWCRDEVLPRPDDKPCHAMIIKKMLLEAEEVIPKAMNRKTEPEKKERKGMPNRIMELETNFCQGGERAGKILLAPRMILHGKVGSGKSRVPLSIQVLLTKKADDSLWRDNVARLNTIMLAKPPRDEFLTIKARFEDGRTATYIGNETGTKVYDNIGLDDPWTLPARNLLSWLRAGPEAIHAKILELTQALVTPQEIRESIPKEYQDHVNLGGTTPTTVQELTRHRELCKTRIEVEETSLITDKARLDIRREEVKNLEQATLPGLIRSAAASADFVERAIKLKEKASTVLPSKEETEVKLAALTTVIERMKGVMDTRFPLPAPKPIDPPQPILQVIPEYQPPELKLKVKAIGYGVKAGEALIQVGIQGDTRCPACGQATNTPMIQAWNPKVKAYVERELAVFQADQKLTRDAYEEMKAEIETRNIELEEAWGKNCKDIRQAWLQESEVRRVKRAQAQDIMQAKLLEQAKLQQTLELINAQQAPVAMSEAELSQVEGLTLETLKTMSEAQKKVLTSLQAAPAKFDEITRLATELEEKSSLREWWAKYDTKLIEATAILIRRQIEDFTTRTMEYLPPDWVLTVKTEEEVFEKDGKKRILALFRPGLMNQGDAHYFLSSGQRAIILMAMSLAALTYLPRQPLYALLALPLDAGIDGIELASVARAFSKAPEHVQIILTSVEGPTGIKPAGWLVMDLDKANRVPKAKAQPNPDQVPLIPGIEELTPVIVQDSQDIEADWDAIGNVESPGEPQESSDDTQPKKRGGWPKGKAKGKAKKAQSDG